MDRNRRFNKRCINCNNPITDRATRCKSCAMKKKGLAQSIWHKCPNCEKDTRRKPSQVAKNKSGLFFCSRGCQLDYHKKRRPVLNCAYCGKEFVFTDYHINRITDQTTCSVACRRALGRVVKTEFTCQNCNKKFMQLACLKTGLHAFCSMSCKLEWFRGPNHPSYNSVSCVCEICGSEFTRTKARVDKFGGKYCSRECSSASQVLPAANYYGPNWPRQRRKARKRDNHTCQRCRMTRLENGQALDVHHIIPFRQFGLENFLEANDLSNLTSLCKSCHRTVEKNPTEATLFLEQL